MKALCKQTMGFILMILLACGVTSIKAQDSADDEFITVSGVVKDKQTRKTLEYVNISIPGTNVGTITNNDGEFSIKVKNGLHARQVEVSHIGYLNGLIQSQAPPFLSVMWRTDSIPMPFPERLEDWKILFFCCILPSKVFSTWIRRR